MLTASMNESLVPLIGEFAWHSLVEDPRIEGESKRHYQLITSIIKKHSQLKPKQWHILEIACYAHTTGYMLEEEMQAKVTLFELSRHALLTGQSISQRSGMQASPLLVSGDFHQLPFEDDSFNLVFICSALHHTWRYQEVLKEMLRVLAPGGILFFENEPTLRECCFYKFRCNRIHDFTPLEKKLDELGIIRTVAEPYLGSRPEMLFDMIENQTIPLNDMLALIGQTCDLKEINLYPEACMGPLEQQWLELRGLGQQELEKMIYENLSSRCQQAEQFLDEQVKGLGFDLPQEQELKNMAAWVSAQLAQLPMNSNLFEFRQKLSILFGAPIQLTAQKRSSDQPQVTMEAMMEKRDRFKAKWQKFEGVHNTFSPAIREVLGQPSLCPDIQQSNAEQIRQFFPAQDWTTSQGDLELIAMADLEHQLLAIINQDNQARINLPDQAMDNNQAYLLVLRFFCQVEENNYFKITLLANDKELYSFNAFASENVLAKVILSSACLKACDRQLLIKMTSLGETKADKIYKIAVSYSGYFQVDQFFQ